MKKIVALLGLLALLTVSRTQAQSMGSEYRTAIGAKFWPGGLTIKHFIRDNRALEGVAYFWGHGFRFTGLYEVHGDINSAPGLKWYVGSLSIACTGISLFISLPRCPVALLPFFSTFAPLYESTIT